ncbi:GxxExxY protein [Flavobacterium sp. DG2-3]|uniref:GxxExxY protein n=1 Tax=Flavobacterium sp. DG2-3 TaxID=3068317 RepID=UPI00273E32D3|nr:GxxExxY protein [Flavobacterium sp. DG2-3]MDP5201152.1 GxxExxY protein [Flavobacterium sp. DG2-3]
MITQKYLDELSFNVIGACIEVHKAIGKGLLESVYHECLKEELSYRRINFFTEMNVPLIYRDKELSANLKCDLFIENCLVLELKASSELNPIYEAQLMTYMKLLKAPKGVLINFNCFNIFKEGQKAFVNEYFKLLPKF